MNEFIDNLLEELEEGLTSIDEKYPILLERSRQSVIAIQQTIFNLKEQLTPFHFDDMDTEIDFFRNRLPKFYSQLIYHLRVFHMETSRTSASQKLYKKLLQNELKEINRFLEKQSSFCKYYNSGNNFLDAELFTRGQPQLPYLLIDYSMALDPAFCTTYTIVISEILAFEKLQNYVLEELRKLNGIPTTANSNISQIKSRRWLLGPFALIEIGYLIHLTGGLSGTLKSTMEFLEQVFETKLGNYSRVLQEMRIRKGERATFLNKGIKAFYDHMDKLDDNIR